MVLSAERPYRDRREAAERLGESLSGYRVHHPVILGIPRGGIVIAGGIADRLDAELDIVLTRKLRAPGNPELAIGAVSENGELYIQRRIAGSVGAGEDYIEKEKERQLAEIQARGERYRRVLTKVPLGGRTAVIVDDGVATGATMQAAIWAARDEGPRQIVVAVPVGARDTVDRLEQEVDAVVCPCLPEYFYAIGQFYADFSQVEEQEVMAILQAHAQRQHHGVGG